MKHASFHRTLCLLLSLALVLSLSAALIPSAAAADPEVWIVEPTGYTSAADVVYVKSGGHLTNWGVREETAVFLSAYAEEFYTDSNTFEAFSAMAGGTAATAPSSALYQALQAFMTDRHTYATSYAATRDLYKYTDCMASTSSNISSFYSGVKLNGAWDSGATWNREHTWPNSKISGNGENDIMMLRPTWVQENSDRGNTAYGSGTGYYDPNKEAKGQFNLHGDCARIVLYVYVRWGVTDTMWGSAGVMESLDVLLSWMEEDPVDTWEMGRNDAVQDITGTRNVFVDYPELAWLLFNQEVPENYPSPSGSALPGHTHDYQEVSRTNPTCTESGTILFRCTVCGNEITQTVEALGHEWSEWAETTAPTCITPGEESRMCARCMEIEARPVDAPGHDWDEGVVTMEPTITEEGVMTYTCRRCGETRTEAIEKLSFLFDDVQDPGKFYYNAVYWAYFHTPQITTGTSATMFTPGKVCTRGQVVTFLWRAMGEPAPQNRTHSFTDVKEGAYYYEAMLWAVETGVTSGTSVSTFSPNKEASRGQVVTFLWRAMGEPAPQNRTHGFTDVKEGAYYYEAMLWAVETGVTSGSSATTFSPNKTATRGHVVTFLYRAVYEEV